MLIDGRQNKLIPVSTFISANIKTCYMQRFIPVFEPNLFSLLAGGGLEDQKVSFSFGQEFLLSLIHFSKVLNEALEFFEGMLDFANRLKIFLSS